MACPCQPQPGRTGWTTGGSSLKFHFFSCGIGNSPKGLSYCTKWEKNACFCSIEPPLQMLCKNCLKRVQLYIENGWLPESTWTG